MYFFGWCISGLTFAPLADKYGRRIPALLGLGAQLIVYFGVMVNKNLNAMYALWFMIGLLASARSPIMYCLGVELLP